MSSIKRGSVRAWFPARNFGFVSETGTGLDAFAHASAFEFDRNLIEVGMLVEYEVVGRKHKGGDGLGAINIHPRSNPSKPAEILSTDIPPSERKSRVPAQSGINEAAKKSLSTDATPTTDSNGGE